MYYPRRTAMKTNDRLLAIDSSAQRWSENVPGMPQVDVTLMRLMRVASQGITACFDPILRTAGLTESSFHTLVVIVGSGSRGTTPTALCEQVGQNRANMTRILDLLLSENLVRVGVHERDARRKRVSVTAAGRRLIKAYAARFAPIVEEVFRRLDAKDKREFERLLRTVISSMDAAERVVGRTA
jgi:DNA-binding MarR family transcriptional regulator